MKEKLLAGLAFLGGFGLGQIRTLETYLIDKNCQAIYVEAPFMWGGLTLPFSLDGSRSIIFTATKNMLRHEKGHVLQICERGSLRFFADYFDNPQLMENDADRRFNQ